MSTHSCSSSYTYDLHTGEKLTCISTVPNHERHYGKAYGIMWYWKTWEEDKS